MKRIVGFITVSLLVLFSYHFLDKQTALFVRSLWKQGTRMSLFSMNVPDVLFPLVCVITASAWGMYFYLSRKGVQSRNALYFQLVAIAVPASFLIKTFLKAVFGRINTRYWLYHPNLNHLHWLHGRGNYTGFPSGHMAVFTALAVATMRFYPGSRAVCWVTLALLAAALILTDYHFVADVIAGAYLGFIVVQFSDQCRRTFSPSRES